MLHMNFAGGISGFNLASFFALCWTGIMLAAFLPASQAYLFTEFLGIDVSRHGTVGGSLAFWGEVAFVIVAGLCGALSDRIGRRPIMAFAFALMAVGVYFYSRATALSDVYIGRVVFAGGAACYSVMIVSIIADYAQNDSRGKLTGAQGIFNGLGAMAAVLLFVKLPEIFQARGMEPVAAGQAMYTGVLASALLASLIAFFGLKKDTAASSGHVRFVDIFREGIRAAKNQRVLIAYAAAFVSRGNIAIVGTFFILWLTNYGSSTGMDRAEAFAKGGMLVGVTQFCALLSAPVFGILADRVDRVTALMISLAAAAIGYGSTYFVTDPFGVQMFLCAAVIGIGEIGTIITSSTLIAEEAPERSRGAVIGFFSLCGAIGIMAAAKIGGYLFDNWHPTGPFVLFAILAMLALIWAFFVTLSGRSVSR